MNEGKDGDMEAILFDARLTVARGRLHKKEYQAAEKQFRTCLLNTAIIEQLPLHAIVELKLDLASACDGSGNRAGQKEALLDTLKLDLPTAQQLHLQHTLAVAYLNDGELGSARQLAEITMQGRRNLLGPKHESFYSSIQLPVIICNAESEPDDADVYRLLLPENSEAKHSQSTSMNQQGLNSTRVPPPTPQVQRTDLMEEPRSVPPSTKTLYVAAYEGDRDQIRWLLDHGAEVEQPAALGAEFGGKGVKDRIVIPLIHAARAGHVDTVRLLLDRGADIKASTTSQSTALLFAAQQGHTSVVELLIDRGADIATVNKKKFTALMSAAVKGHIDVVECLLERGADINAVDVDNYTALIHTVARRREGCINVVKVLIERGADTTIRNKNSSAAIHFSGPDTELKQMLTQGQPALSPARPYLRRKRC